MLKFLVVLAAVMSASASHVAAQSADSLQTRAIELTVTAASGPLPFGVATGAYQDVGLRWERSIVRAGRFDLRYAPELLPQVRVDRAQYFFSPLPCPPPACSPAPPSIQPEATSGTGVIPAGFRLDYDLGAGFALTAATRTGLLFLSRAAPSAAGGGTSFLLEGGLGLRWRSEGGRTLRVEWAATSVSNGGYRLDRDRLTTSGVRIAFGTSTLSAFPRLDASASTIDSDTWELTAAAGTIAAPSGADFGAQLAAITWHRQRVIAGGDRVALSAGFAVLPVLVARFEAITKGVASYCTYVSCLDQQPGTDPYVGVGIAPLAVKARVRVARPVHLWFELLGGGVVFDHAYPVPGARRFNFLLETGLGVAVDLSPTRALLLGARGQHLSNANTAPQNPGLNLLALVVGWSVRR